MAKVFIEETTLTAIGDAIRGKEGTADLVPVNDMATRITNLPSGGGGNEPTDEELLITGESRYRFAYNGWNWVIEKYGDRLTTKDITSLYGMFNYSTKLAAIPITLNINNCEDFRYCFSDCKKLTTSPKIRGSIKWYASTSFENCVKNCENLASIEELLTAEMLEGFSSFKVTGAYSAITPVKFEKLCALRQIPSWWYKFRLNEESTAFPSASYTLYYNSFTNCQALDEITNIPVWKCTAAMTSNMFNNAFSYTNRVKSIIFETNEDGTTKTAQWKAQTIDLTSYVGYARSATYITDYNSGLTTATQVKDDATYQALKNDPDWWTIKLDYSRYNHDSAVETINSLPDTSAYLATAGGTNTIKFKKGSGSLTDGGNISNLTEEEIAVAAAKGWTVTLVA